MNQSKDFITFYRRLPHWRQAGSVYFITFRLLEGILSDTEITLVKGLILEGHPRFYLIYGGVVMPDHVHLVLQPGDQVSLSRITKGTKGKSARLVNKGRGVSGSLWQDESWDRIVRDEKELAEKLQYMFDNPLKKGLCTDTTKYVGWIAPPEIERR